jgi:hypothetical protein
LFQGLGVPAWKEVEMKQDHCRTDRWLELENSGKNDAAMLPYCKGRSNRCCCESFGSLLQRLELDLVFEVLVHTVVVDLGQAQFCVEPRKRTGCCCCCCCCCCCEMATVRLSLEDHRADHCQQYWHFQKRVWVPLYVVVHRWVETSRVN